MSLQVSGTPMSGRPTLSNDAATQTIQYQWYLVRQVNWLVWRWDVAYRDREYGGYALGKAGARRAARNVIRGIRGSFQPTA